MQVVKSKLKQIRNKKPRNSSILFLSMIKVKILAGHKISISFKAGEFASLAFFRVQFTSVARLVLFI